MTERKKTKADLVETIYENIYDSNIDKKHIYKVIDSFLTSIKTSLAEGETIELRGFGTFEPRLRNGRKKARNPKTGERLSYGKHYVAVFRPGQELKQKMKDFNEEEIKK